MDAILKFSPDNLAAPVPISELWSLAAVQQANRIKKKKEENKTIASTLILAKGQFTMWRKTSDVMRRNAMCYSVCELQNALRVIARIEPNSILAVIRNRFRNMTHCIAALWLF